MRRVRYARAAAALSATSCWLIESLKRADTVEEDEIGLGARRVLAQDPILELILARHTVERLIPLGGQVECARVVAT